MSDKPRQSFLTLAEEIIEAMDAAGDGGSLPGPERALWAVFHHGGGWRLVRALRVARDVAKLEASGMSTSRAYAEVGHLRGMGLTTVRDAVGNSDSNAPRASVGFLDKFTAPGADTDDTEVQ